MNKSNNSELRYWHYGYRVAVFLYCTLFVAGHYGEIATLQLACTFHDAVNLALLRLGAAHVVAYLYQTLYTRPLTQWHEASFLAEFFRLNAEYLQQPFWKDYFSEPEDAAKDVIVDATALERYINQLADNAKNGETP